jgi:hypothetical protein
MYCGAVLKVVLLPGVLTWRFACVALLHANDDDDDDDDVNLCLCFRP